MKAFWFKRRVAVTLLGGVGALTLAGSLPAYVRRRDRPVAFYYGAAPEVPGGTAIAVLNPFRNRKDEANAEWLIRDLRTPACDEIAANRLRVDPARLCTVLRANTIASLIWLDAESDGRHPRTLFYDLPESESRLAVHFQTDEVGWGVATVSLLH